MLRSSLLTALVAFTPCMLTSHRAHAQLDVFNNQSNFGLTSIGFSSQVTMWDDLQLTQGGLLSEISFIARPPTGQGMTASGTIDLRVFDELLNQPQGAPIATLPFSGTFLTDPNDIFNQRLVIELTDLESQNITLPAAGRIGAGITFDNTGWFFPDAGTPELGSSPGGNWLDSSSFERNDVSGLAWRVAIAEPEPMGPGVGSYQVFESGLSTPDDPFQNSGTSIDADFYSGLGFHIERPTHLKQIGAWIRGSGTIFAAIVDVGSSQFNAPDLSGSDVLATTLIDLPGFSAGGQDVLADFDLMLDPGNYAVVYGANMFGADSDANAGLRDSHIPNGRWSNFTLRQSDGLKTISAGNYRVFALADSEPGTLQVRPKFDALAEVFIDPLTGSDTGVVRLIDGDPLISVSDFMPSSDPREVALLEFSIDDLPTDRDLLGAKLEIDIFSADLSPPTTFAIYGYSGNGTPDRQDAVNLDTLIGTGTVTGFGVASFNLDPNFISGLAGSTDYLGLALVHEGDGDFTFSTLEGGELFESPLLTFILGEGPPIGDFDGDGFVGLADLNVLGSNWMTLGTATNATGDANGDGNVDLADLNLLGSNWDPPLPPTRTVPEPSSLLLFLGAPTLCLMRPLHCNRC